MALRCPRVERTRTTSQVALLRSEFDDGEAVVFEAKAEGVSVPTEDFAAKVSEVEWGAPCVHLLFSAYLIEFLILLIGSGEALDGMGHGHGDAELFPIEGDFELLVVVGLGDMRDDRQNTW